MTEKKTMLVIQHLEASKYLDAIQCLQDELLKIEVKPKMAGSDRRQIKTMSSVIDKISEAAAFGKEWEEGRRAEKAAIVRLQKLITS
ncbi:MAG TPA: hypothetical protein VN371_09325 [Chlorobaculum sp.]|nr:hypothetical protein [Chlorobaculum sp.]